MAISHVGALADATANRTTSTTITLNFATAAGDWIFVVFTNGGANADGSIAGTVVTTGGVSFSKGAGINGGGTTTLTGVLWIGRATGNHNGQTIVCSGATDSCASTVEVLRGCHWTTPILVKSEELNASGENGHAALNASGVSGCWLLLGLSCDDNIASASEAATAPATITERAEHLSSGGVDTASTVCAAAMGGTGSTGAISWTNARGAGLYLISMAAVIQPRVDATGTPTTVTPTVVGNQLVGTVADAVDTVLPVATLSQLAGGEATPGTGTIITVGDASPFDLLTLPSLHALYVSNEASSIHQDSAPGAVSQWDDLSGNGRHLIPAFDSTHEPSWGTRTENGELVVDFVTGNRLYYNGFNLSQPFTVFIVAAWDGAANLGRFYDNPNSGTDRTFFDAGGGSQWLIYASSSVRYYGTCDTAFHLHAIMFDGASTEARVDGNNYSPGDPGTAMHGDLFLGWDAAGSNLDGAIAVIAFCAGDQLASYDDVFNNYAKPVWGVDGGGSIGGGLPVVINTIVPNVGGAPVTKVVSASPQQPTVSVGGAPTTKAVLAFSQQLVHPAPEAIDTVLVSAVVQAPAANVGGTVGTDVATALAQQLVGTTANPVANLVATAFLQQLQANVAGAPITDATAAVVQALTASATGALTPATVAVLAQQLQANPGGMLLAVAALATINELAAEGGSGEVIGTPVTVAAQALAQTLAGGITQALGTDVVLASLSALVGGAGGAPASDVVSAFVQQLVGATANPVGTDVVAAFVQALTATGTVTVAILTDVVAASAQVLAAGVSEQPDTLAVLAAPQTLSAASGGTLQTDVVLALAQILAGGAAGQIGTETVAVLTQVLGADVGGTPQTDVVLATINLLVGVASVIADPIPVPVVVVLGQPTAPSTGVIATDPAIATALVVGADVGGTIDTVLVTAVAQVLVGVGGIAGVPVTIAVQATPEQLGGSAGGTIATDVVTAAAQTLTSDAVATLLTDVVTANAQTVRGGSADPLTTVQVAALAQQLAAKADVITTPGTVHVTVNLSQLLGNASGVLIPDTVLVTIAQLVATAAAPFTPPGGVVVTVIGTGGAEVTVGGGVPPVQVIPGDDGGGVASVTGGEGGRARVRGRAGVTARLDKP